MLRAMVLAVTLIVFLAGHNSVRAAGLKIANSAATSPEASGSETIPGANPVMVPPPPGASEASSNEVLNAEIEAARAAARENGDISIRMARAARIKALGYDVDWRKHTREELMDVELRIRKVADLRALGFRGTWETYSYDELLDREKRLHLMAELDRQGLDYASTNATAELADVLARIKQAERLKSRGREVDWRLYTLPQLSEMERTLWRLRAGR